MPVDRTHDKENLRAELSQTMGTLRQQRQVLAQTFSNVERLSERAESLVKQVEITAEASPWAIPGQVQCTIQGLIRHLIVTTALRKPYREYHRQAREYIRAAALSSELNIPLYSINRTVRRTVDDFVVEQLADLHLDFYKEVIHSVRDETATSFAEFLHSTLTRYDMSVITRSSADPTYNPSRLLTRHRRGMLAFLRTTATLFTLDMADDINFKRRALLLAGSFEKRLSECLAAMGNDRSRDDWISWTNRQIEQERLMCLARMDRLGRN